MGGKRPTGQRSKNIRLLRELLHLGSSLRFHSTFLVKQGKLVSRAIARSRLQKKLININWYPGKNMPFPDSMKRKKGRRPLRLPHVSGA